MLEQDIVLQDQYRIVRVLDGGGMGQTYLAHDTRLADKPCAVKEMTPDSHATIEEQEQAADQFHHEAAILAHPSYPNLPNVYDYFEEPSWAASSQGESTGVFKKRGRTRLYKLPISP
jgi:serine/threonine protein kinase